MILPFKGQGEELQQLQKEAKLSTSRVEKNVASSNLITEAVEIEKRASVQQEKVPEKRKEAEPVIAKKKIIHSIKNLNTPTIGIKETLNPKENSKSEELKELLTGHNNDFTLSELEELWEEYALNVKREKRDLLYSTLTNSKPQLSSDYQVSLKIFNSIQSTELEREKMKLVNFLRLRLKNDTINFSYKLTESKKVSVLDSKTSFDKLAEENANLDKFRKLFNLDIEF